MNKEALRRLPKQEIWATTESMLNDLESEFNRVHAIRDERERSPAALSEFIFGLSKLRCLAEEILRWELL